jgi:hypothetical protein
MPLKGFKRFLGMNQFKSLIKGLLGKNVTTAYSDDEKDTLKKFINLTNTTSEKVKEVYRILISHADIGFDYAIEDIKSSGIVFKSGSPSTAGLYYED